MPTRGQSFHTLIWRALAEVFEINTKGLLFVALLQNVKERSVVQLVCTLVGVRFVFQCLHIKGFDFFACPRCFS